MDVLEKFKDLFIDVWTDGIAGVNISEILIAVVTVSYTHLTLPTNREV